MIIRSFACLVAPLDPLRELDLLGRREQLVAPELVHEERERVGRPRRRRVMCDACARLARLVPLELDGRHDFDLAYGELGPDRGELLVVELTLEGECLQLRLVDDATLLGVLEKDVNVSFEQAVHQSLVVIHAARLWARRLSKRSMRPPRATARSMPVYAGWQLEQTSTTISLRVERVVNAFPQVLQRTLACTRSGCLSSNVSNSSRMSVGADSVGDGQTAPTTPPTAPDVQTTQTASPFPSPSSGKAPFPGLSSSGGRI